MDESTRQKVRRRAGDRCEYCLITAEDALLPLQIEHITALKHGGSSELDNLALACHRCNLHKGPNLAGLDPDNGDLVRLYNPRAQVWQDHFRFQGARIQGTTEYGRTTVFVLNMNEESRVQLRELCGYGKS